MSRFESVSAIVSAISLVVIAFTFMANAAQMFYVAKQARAAADANMTILRHDLTDATQDITKVFVDHPELRKYFFDGAPVPEIEGERAAAFAVAQMYFDVMYYTFESTGPFDKENRELWEAFFRGIVVRSPVMQEYWVQYAEWYGSDIAAMTNRWL